ncbi:hypothetical protein [Kineococcus sp. G2]|uniref:hypothetical protein n=1 Tax=Kineococcus sp. G2 TaxID=3127484 RepID=UPI00301C4F08
MATSDEDFSQTPWVPKIGLVVLAATSNALLMGLLGVDAKVIAATSAVGGIAAAIIAMPDKGAVLRGRSKRFYVGLAAVLVLPALLGWIVHRATADTPLDVAVKSFSPCRDDGRHCELVGKVDVGSGTGIVSVYGVNRRMDGSEASDGSALLFLDADGKILWKSEFLAGYGLTSLETDALQHVFATFAVTNHSGVLWVLAISPEGVQNFGTIGGNLKVESSDGGLGTGVRELYAYREGWPANTQNTLTSRDLFRWDGDSYVFVGCEVVRNLALDPKMIRFFAERGELAAPHVRHEVVNFREAGADGCVAPAGDYSFKLDGDRQEGQPPP